MRLTSIEYIEHSGTDKAWSLGGLLLGSKNLIVGKNASGKTRTLNTISGLARQLTGPSQLPVTGAYECVFEHEDKTYRYSISYRDAEVELERLAINDKVMLDRGAGGIGEITALALKEESVKFQTPTSLLAVVARRDAIQHPYLEPLYQWAAGLRHFRFGTPLGQASYAVIVKDSVDLDDRDQDRVVGVFRRAVKEHGRAFIDALIEDLARVEYHVDDVGIAAPTSVIVQGPAEVVGLYVHEKDLSLVTDQFGMSQGMFRVLSLLIQVNYSALSRPGACIVIDDIGEGLDFDRSCRLLQLLREKADASNIQLIMSTNDRFVMNQVPLEEWSFLQRKGSAVSVRNIVNSKERFEEFKFTGLSNFSFLEMDFINTAQSELH